MKKIILSIGLAFLSILKLTGQSYEFSLKGNFGTFQMESLKDFQRGNLVSISQEIDVPLKITDDFPSYFGAELQFVKSELKFQYGAYLNTFSTGGKIAYSDYSGSLNVENLIRNISIGGIFNVSLIENEAKVKSYIGFLAGASIVDYQIKSETILTGISNSTEIVKFNGVNISLTPNFKFNFHVLKNLFITSNCGLQFDIPGKLYLNSNSNAYLLDNAGNEVKADFSGLRVGLGLGWVFNENK